MSVLFGLFPFLAPYRLLIEIGIALALAAAVAFYIHHVREEGIVAGRAEVQQKWDAERVALKADVQAQQDRNLELQRAAEKAYFVITPVREHYITKTVTEVRHATESLAACPVPADAVRLLNGAASCASQDSATACGAGDAVQPTK